MNRIGIIGATGYVGMELVRLVSMHPNAQLTLVVSHNFAGTPFSNVYPYTKKVVDLTLETIDIPAIVDKCDIVFVALPHCTTQKYVNALLNEGVRVIDMSADFRYDSSAVYQQWYDVPHEYPHLLERSVYGLPELHREEIQHTSLVGNPGCYTTCSILALAPLVKEKLVDLDNLIIDAKSGVTGAGRTSEPSFSFCECNENFKAYKIATHRHTSEIEQELSKLADTPVILSFTPHLVPMQRGILSTCYANLLNICTYEQIFDLYKSFYANEPFVRLCSKGTLPETKHVYGSNFIDIGFVIDERLNRIVVVSCIDNLVKGAAGQAIQNMNILLGLHETTGLMNAGIYL